MNFEAKKEKEKVSRTKINWNFREGKQKKKKLSVEKNIDW